MRNRYLVTYDVSDDKRLRRVFKKMKAFGLHLQLSVFECELSGRELAMMKAGLDALIHHDDDQVLIADLGPSDGTGRDCIEWLGRPLVELCRKAVVL